MTGTHDREMLHFLCAMHDIKQRLDEINTVETEMGAPCVQDQTQTWEERAAILIYHAEALADQSWSDLESIGIVLNTLLAYAVAFKFALALAEEARTDIGGDH